jgi:CheY-like chemotaxis protein
MPVRVLIVDDDEVSREVLELLVRRAGYEVEAVESGAEALAHMEGAETKPEVVLADLHMPGVAGDELARGMRALCGSKSLLLAMSGSLPETGSAPGFDGFLLKPFTIEALAEAIGGGAAKERSESGSHVMLNDAVFRMLEESMTRARLGQLYALCLKDSEERIAKMRRAASDGDDAAYRREAHALRGGCGVVGADELQTLAASMETRGLCGDHVVSLDEFVQACGRLKRMLIAHEIISRGELSGEMRK